MEKRILRGDKLGWTKEACSKGGIKSIERVKREGWGKEAIEKRVATRRLEGTFNNTMESCHTPEANLKRTQTRRNNDNFPKNPSHLWEQSCINKKEKTKIKNILKKIATHYKQQFSLELLVIARKQKITYLHKETIEKYFTKEELDQLTFPL